MQYIFSYDSSTRSSKAVYIGDTIQRMRFEGWNILRGDDEEKKIDDGGVDSGGYMNDDDDDEKH